MSMVQGLLPPTPFTPPLFTPFLIHLKLKSSSPHPSQRYPIPLTSPPSIYYLLPYPSSFTSSFSLFFFILSHLLLLPLLFILSHLLLLHLLFILSHILLLPLLQNSPPNSFNSFPSLPHSTLNLQSIKNLSFK